MGVAYCRRASQMKGVSRADKKFLNRFDQSAQQTFWARDWQKEREKGKC